MSSETRTGATSRTATARLLSSPALALAARLALVSAFLVSGIMKTLNFPGAVAEVRALTGLEPAGLVAILVIFVQLGGAALVIAGGRFVWLGAGVLAGFTLAATLFAHAFWMKSGADQVRDMNTFFEHLGLIGGLSLAAMLSARDPRRRRAGASP